MAKFILDGQEYGGGSGGNVIKLTQAEYDALPNDKLSDDNIYLITDSGELTAENLFYDDTETGLGVNNVQDAIVEQNKKIVKFKKLENLTINDVFWTSAPHTFDVGEIITEVIGIVIMAYKPSNTWTELTLDPDKDIIFSGTNVTCYIHSGTNDSIRQSFTLDLLVIYK